MRTFIALVLVAVLAAGCGGDSDDNGSGSAGDDTATTTAAESTDTTAADDSADDAGAAAEDDAGSDDASSTAGANASARVVLANGETFDFSVLCVLESQEAAGSTILFTATSYDRPYHFDLTQFGDDSFGGSATVSIYDAETFDTLWEANSMVGATLELVKDGSTITGSGTFLPAGEFGAEGVEGTVEVNC